MANPYSDDSSSADCSLCETRSAEAKTILKGVPVATRVHLGEDAGETPWASDFQHMCALHEVL